jgi:hypothetical protein
MSVNEYLDKFTQLSRYAPDEVNTDPKRQERFLDGLIGPLYYQLQSHTFPDFATLLNKAIGLENKCKDLGEQKCKFQSQGQSSINTHPRYSFPQNPQFRSGGQSGKYPQNMQLQRSFQQPQRFNPQTPCTPNFQQNRPAHTAGAPVRNTTHVQPNGCFKCGELGHYANNCPKRGMQTPQRSNVQKVGQASTPARPGNSSTTGNKAQQNYVRSKVNNMIVEQAHDASGVVLGTFPINSVPATVLFESRATHSFITDQFVAKHNMPVSPMKKPLLVSSPGGDMKASHLCPQVNLKIMGVDFPSNLVNLKLWGIDVILGMDWLRKYDGVIQCREKSVHLTSPQGDRIEFIATPSPTGKK